MRARARSARRRCASSPLGTQEAMAVSPSGRSRPEPRPPRSDGPEALTQSCPGPGLELAVAGVGLAARRLEVLEPRVGLLDQQQLLRLTLRRHGITSGVVAHDGPKRRT